MTKEDKVISMDEFNQTAEALESGEVLPEYEDKTPVTPNELFELLAEHDLTNVTIIGYKEGAGHAFWTTHENLSEVVYDCEAFKKIALDFSLSGGPSFVEDTSDNS